MNINIMGTNMNGTLSTFTNEEALTILEIARVALSDAEIYEYCAEKLDLADKELKSLQDKIENATN